LRGKPELFAEFRKANARKRFRGFLAPEYNIRCIEAAVNLPFDEGKAVERKLFLELMGGIAVRRPSATPSSPSAPGLPRSPTCPTTRRQSKVASVGIIGAGTMGGGIAMCFANVGIPVVTMVETAPGRARQAAWPWSGKQLREHRQEAAS
jgi:3-hydroxyacyl-CoA dehydrogenase